MTSDPGQRGRHGSGSGGAVLLAGTGYLAGTQCPVGRDQPRDAVAPETPVRFGGTLVGHGTSVDFLPRKVEEAALPEGHVIHRLAGELQLAFAGRPVAASSPQGRFAAAAELLDQAVLAGAQAYGKNLLIDFGPAPDTGPYVHIHLGLIGKLRWVRPGPVEGAGTLRLRLETRTHAAELRGPQTCALIGPDELASVLAKLGPDPLRADADPDRAWQRVHRSARPIASLLLDQRVAAGVGNIYRAEVLYRARLDPLTPGNEVPVRVWRGIWDDMVDLMPLGVRHGRIDTVRAEHSPEAMGRPPREDAHGGEVYVYRRAGLPCLACGRGVSAREFEGRNLYWCSRCQRRR